MSFIRIIPIKCYIFISKESEGPAPDTLDETLPSKKPGYTDNWIFLPAAGWRRNDDLDDVGFYGYYWSSSLGTYQVYGIYFEWAVINGFFGFRYSGNSVRPVSE